MKRKATRFLATVLIALSLVSSVFLYATVFKASGQSGTDWWTMFRHDLAHSGSSSSTAPSTNQTLWKFNVGGQVGSPVVVDGVVYVGSYDHKLYALDASNGEVIWKYKTQGRVVSRPTVAGGKVYVGSEDHRIYALDASNGNQIWNYTTGYYVDSDPTVLNGTVYVGSEDGKVYALDAETGAYRWSYTTGDIIVFSSAAVVNGKVYIGSMEESLCS
jgi:outer membrane protein assembly factor BamB